MQLSSDERSLLSGRRARILEAMGEGVMLLPAATELIRSGDTHFPFRQDSDFGYVTGFPEPDAIAVLAVGAANPFALFLRPRDPEQAVWVGPRAGVEGAIADYGADVAHPLQDLEKELPAWLVKANQVFLPFGRDDALTRRLHALIRWANGQRPRTGRGPTVLRDAGEIVHELRLTKGPAEIARLRETIAIAAEAHREAMRTVRPGMHEYEIEALIDYIFRRRGASGPAYPSIVAGGANATILHYTANDRPLGADELLLIDAGAECAGYCADVTRTFPTGAASPRPQRDLYEPCSRRSSPRSAPRARAPRSTRSHASRARVLVEALIALGLLAGSVDEVIEKEAYKRFYMHRTSHWLGLDVHDVGGYTRSATRRARSSRAWSSRSSPGSTSRPTPTTSRRRYRGIGIRIEDDVLVTPGGVEVLSAAVPKQVEEIEALRAAAQA